jgi:ectoine hydroxylase-related dioxygenase (phytanoyl-CoA dioxygenase family)
MKNNFKTELNKKGYVIVNTSSLSKSLDKLENDLKTLITNVLKVNFKIKKNLSTSLPELINDLSKNDLLSYFKLIKSAEHLNSLYELYSHQEITRIVKKIFGHNQTLMPVVPRLHVMGCELNKKIQKKGGYSATPIHQDWYPLQSSINTITLWFPITDVGTENYPLEIIPGSHKYGPIKASKHDFGHEILKENLSNKIQNFEKIFLKKGEILLFNMFLIHRTSIHFENDLPRVACGMRFSDINEETYVKKNYFRPFKISPNYQKFDESENKKIIEQLNNFNLF